MLFGESIARAALVGLCCCASVAVTSVRALAETLTILDYADGPSNAYDDTKSYWGGDAPPAGTTDSYQDVVSNNPTDTRSHFEIKKAEVTVQYAPDKTSLIVDIYTNYRLGLKTFYGDLFLTSFDNYDPLASPTKLGPHFAGDKLDSTGLTGTVWDYALVLDDQAIAVGSSTDLTVYDLSANSNIKTSYAPPAGGGIRAGQPVEYNAGGTVLPGAFGTMQVVELATDTESNRNTANGLYLLKFVLDDLAALASLGNDASGYNFALSWAMTCANDVIQGSLRFVGEPDGGAGPGEVPLPAALSLFMIAVGGLAAVGRWRKRLAA